MRIPDYSCILETGETRREDEMESERTRIKLIEERPSGASHRKSYRARHLVLDREVEFRLARSGPEALQSFRKELAALSFLDDPAFPPVLDRGGFQGRDYYAVPYRVGPTLRQAAELSNFSLAHRCEALRDLAGAMGALHQQGISLGVLSPDQFRWDPIRRRVFVDSLFPEGAPDPGGPEDGSTWVWDVISWGTLGYQLLSPGKPTHAGQQFVPTRARNPLVHPDLAEVLDACILGPSEDCPANGIELHALLGVRHRSLLSPPVEAKPESEALVHCSQSLGELRQTGELPSPGSFQQPNLGEPEKEAPGLVVWFRESGEKTKEISGRAAWAMGLGLLLFLFWLTRGGEVKRPPPPTLAPPARLDVPVPDPYLRTLLDLPPVTPDGFRDAWELVWSLFLQRRLPPAALDSKRLRRIREGFDQDPEEGCRLFQEFREELSRSLSVEDPGGTVRKSDPDDSSRD